MQIQELWRYPVKSMRGERVTEAVVRTTGIEGDRNIVVVSNRGDRVITARTHSGLLALNGSIDRDGLTLINGVAWHSAEAFALASDAAGEPVRLVNAGERTERFDVLPLLVATDGAIQALGIERRRLRPNVVIEGVEGQAERSWAGRSLVSEAVIIEVAQLRRRCVMTTYDPDTLEQDHTILRKIVREVAGKIALDCAVARGGTLREGATISLTP